VATIEKTIQPAVSRVGSLPRTRSRPRRQAPPRERGSRPIARESLGAPFEKLQQPANRCRRPSTSRRRGDLPFVHAVRNCLERGYALRARNVDQFAQLPCRALERGIERPSRRRALPVRRVNNEISSAPRLPQRKDRQALRPV
jgi:hypothetical protein